MERPHSADSFVRLPHRKADRRSDGSMDFRCRNPVNYRSV